MNLNRSINKPRKPEDVVAEGENQLWRKETMTISDSPETSHVLFPIGAAVHQSLKEAAP